MIAGPLELSSRLAPPPRDLDVFFWLNAGVVVLFFALLGSPFIVAPGVAVQVGRSAALDLPEAVHQQLGTVSVVVSYRRDDMILFEGGNYTLEKFRPVLEREARRAPRTTMSVWIDKQVTMQGLMALSDLAREVGVVNLFILVEPAEEKPPTLVQAGR